MTTRHRVETLNYRPGGFHPVHLNDIFKKGRYTVLHKLGHGGFATVWLARDSVRNRYVALKILASRLSQDCPEVSILRRLRNWEGDDRGKQYVMSMLDHFWIDGPNGKHLCVVSEVGGPSIKQFNECPGLRAGTRRLRAKVARKVALQATEGLAYIHSTGIVHGDYTAANILLQLANIDAWTISELHERLGAPQTQALTSSPASSSSSSSPSGPRYTVNAISMKLVDPRWLSDSIMIIDFGIAFLFSPAISAEPSSSSFIGTPKNYCAPEFNFDAQRSMSSDIWALGCTVFEIRTGACLFVYRGVPTRDQMLIEMVKILGDLPAAWWEAWERGRHWYELETLSGGRLEDILKGTLHSLIMEIGHHDGDTRLRIGKDRDMGFSGDLAVVDEKKKSSSSSDKHINTTKRLVDLVEELTTSEAQEVMRALNKSSNDESPEGSGNNSKEKESGSSGEKVPSSGSGQKNSGSSNSNSKEKSIPSSSSKEKSIPSSSSKEKSIPSEGLSTGVHSVPGHSSENHSEIAVEMDNQSGYEDFLEPGGTVVTVEEADCMENLLREALAYLPEERAGALELARHKWFGSLPFVPVLA